ncbi:MAG: RagB/SusD family nutrient uptake outer membrane protein [Sphingobacteriales bacterium]|nr:MAG: RagB/SusD family nutrient uptake outer membrane protein [Sphingobacteriales bacterium]
MKKIINFNSVALLLVLLVSMGSCKKFLDQKPLGATIDDLNQGGIEAEVFGIYSYMRTNTGFVGISWLAFHDFRSDDSEKGSDPSDGQEWTAPFDNYQYVKNIWANDVYWDNHVQLVNLANIAIAKADSIGATDATTRANLGEAHFFRAFAYFDMVRTYGSVPIYLTPTKSAADLCKTKATIPDVYALIDTDLTFAAANLPADWGSAYEGRLTSGAALALHAKAHLYRQNWGAALGLCQQVISRPQYGLYTPYYGIFKDAGENSKESLFEIQAYVSPDGSKDLGTEFATTQGVRASQASGWNLGWGWNTPTDALVAAYEPNDVRKGSTILFSGQSDDVSTGGYGRTLPAHVSLGGPLPRKYWNKKIYADPAYRVSTGMSDNPRWINKRVIRYSDVLLMAAEASNELGQGATGINWMNDVRGRAGLAAKTYTTPAQLRLDIKQERRVEFGVEGERFFDLVRWGDAVNVLGGGGYTNRCRFYPIPQKVIDACPNVILQNPEW